MKMTTVYSDVVASLEGFIRGAGFSVEKIGDYDAVMSISNFFVHSSIEKYYPSSISMYVLTPASNKYEVGLLEEIIDPKRSELDRSELSDAFESLKLDPSNLNSEDMQNNLHKYLKINLVKLIDFLDAHRDIIFDIREPYKNAYLDKSKERLSRIGL
jgi:hypothetical protein